MTTAGLGRRFSRKQLVILGLILAGSAVAYLPAIDGDFQFDDVGILSNALVTNPLGRGVLPWLTLNRPVTSFTFALNYLVVGVDTRGWHLTNLAIHLSVVVLGWAFVRVTLLRAGFSRADGLALTVAGVFALHPLQTESVAYIVQRAECLASGIYLAVLLLLLLRDTETRPWARRVLLAVIVGLHAIGLATKPILVTLPAAWLLHVVVIPAAGEVHVPARCRVRRRLKTALLLLTLSAGAAIWIAVGLDTSSQAGFELPGLSAPQYFATQLRVIPTYLLLLAWPTGQCADWFFPASGGFLESAVLGGAALLCSILAGAIFITVRVRDASGAIAGAARTASFGALFFLLVLAPTSSILPLRDPLAEHRAYLASLGVIMAAVAGVSTAIRQLAGTRSALAGAAIAVAVMLSAGIATARRSAVWASSSALWCDAAQKAPEKARVNANLGYALLELNRPVEALSSLYKARDRRGDHTVSGKTLFESIVAALIAAGQSDEARAEIQSVLAVNPHDANALAELAAIEFATGRDDECERDVDSALAADRSNDAALAVLGALLLRRGDAAGAQTVLRRAVETRVFDPGTFEALGIAEERLGEQDRACAAYARAAALSGNGSSSTAARAAMARLRCF